MNKKSPRQESNLYPTLRRRVHYPLCYEEVGGYCSRIATLGALAGGCECVQLLLISFCYNTGHPEAGC
jgi:hypothetical protein